MKSLNGKGVMSKEWVRHVEIGKNTEVGERKRA